MLGGVATDRTAMFTEPVYEYVSGGHASVVITDENVRARNVVISSLIDYEEPDWGCSNPATISSTTPGSFTLNSVCGIGYDDTVRTGTFTPPTITSPTCNESG